MAKPRIQTRVEPDIEESVEEFADDEDINKSTAVRRLMVAGLVSIDRAPEGYKGQSVKKVEDAQTSSTNLDVLTGLLVVSVFVLLVRTQLVIAGFELPSILPINGWLLFGAMWLVLAVFYAVVAFAPERLTAIYRWSG